MNFEKQSVLAFFIIAATSGTLVGCKIAFPESPSSFEGQFYSGEAHKIADFSQGLSPLFHASNGYSNGGMFDCVWNQRNVTIGEDRLLHLSITRENGAIQAGEYRTWAMYGYGYYSVKMKAISRPGIVSSFFVYTGPSDGNPWHEIDIEFLGKDTTKVQFNYFTNGIGGHEYLYSLGFDASEELHEYGFLWEEHKITWLVDGASVYQATTEIPYCQAKMMVNAWPGKSEGNQQVTDWSGKFDQKFPVPDATYAWIGYESLDEKNE